MCNAICRIDVPLAIVPYTYKRVWSMQNDFHDCETKMKDQKISTMQNEGVKCKD